MRRSELPHERQKTNLAEPLASKSWLRRTGKNFIDSAKNGVFQQYQPDSVIANSCCARSQSEKCGMSEKVRAAAQRFDRPFVDVAA